MESLWRKQTGCIETKIDESCLKEQGNHWDVIVIGTGMAGLLSAYYLKKQGKSVVVLEAAKIASGQTERTTAKITSQHGLKYDKLIKGVGEEKARLYARANEEAIAQYEQLIAENKIECRFERVSAYLYTLQNEALLEKEMRAAKKLGIEAVLTKETELPFQVSSALCFKNQAQFFPLEFVKAISSGLDILEDTKVLEIKGNWVVTEKGILTADKIVVTSHYPIKNVPGFYFLRQHQERSYVLALSGCENIKNMYYGIDKDSFSFRQAGELLLFGGSSHRTGKKECIGAYDKLQQEAQQYFPDAKEEMRWSAQDCMPHDGIPFIGKYSIFTPNLYVATGFQKWGMTTSMIAARILSDELCGIKNPYRELFSPQRLNIRAGMGNLLIDVGESAKGLTLGLFQKKRCSHMGCKLVWNPEEKSWDCPCHGSRFEENGNLLDNPAKKDISS